MEITKSSTKIPEKQIIYENDKEIPYKLHNDPKKCFIFYGISPLGNF